MFFHVIIPFFLFYDDALSSTLIIIIIYEYRTNQGPLSI